MPFGSFISPCFDTLCGNWQQKPGFLTERIWGSLGEADTGQWRIWGVGVRDPRPRIGIVICPLFLFWRAGRPV